MDHFKAPASSMLPPPESDETIRYSKREWEQHRSFIEGMYPLKGMGLKAIIACLKEDRGFVVNERQLKRKIKDWNLEKNVKSDEMKVIVRKIQQRAAVGKNTAIRVRGQPVDPSKIKRWQNRCGEVGPKESPSPSSSPSTLSDISYNTIPDLRSPSPYGRNISAGGIDHESSGNPLPPLASPSPVVGQINSVNVFGVDVFSNQGGAEPFEGRSPSPFTAPPSPASTPRKISTAPSHLPRISQIPVAGESVAAGDDVAQAMFQLPPSSQKKRYKQKEEVELTQRLGDLQSRYGTSHPATIDTALRLAEVLDLQGRYRAAELLYKQGANCLHTNFGENDPRTVNAFSELGSCFIQQGQILKAEKLFDMVYLKASQIMSSSDRKFLQIKKDYGYCKVHLGDYATAEQVFREVLAVGSQFLSGKDIFIRDCLRKLIGILIYLGQLSEAEKLLLDVMEMCALCEDVDPLEILVNRAIFAEICRLQRKHHLAEQALREIRETQTSILGREHDHTLATTRALVETLKDLGRFSEGEGLLRDATKISTKILGEKHWITLEMDAVLADLLCKQEKYVEAERIAMQVLRRCGDVYGSKCRIPRLAYMVLSHLCYAQGRLKEALEATKMASESNARMQGPDYGVKLIELEKRLRHITREMDQLRKSGGEDFPRINSP